MVVKIFLFEPDDLKTADTYAIYACEKSALLAPPPDIRSGWNGSNSVRIAVDERLYKNSWADCLGVELFRC